MKIKEEIFFSIQDLKKVFLSNWKKLLFFAILGVLLPLVFVEPKIEFNVAFIDMNREQKESVFLSSIIASKDTKNEFATIQRLIQSSWIVKRAVEKLGLQAEITSSPFNFLTTLTSNLGLLFNDESDNLQIENLTYRKRAKKELILIFTDSNHFNLFDLTGQQLGESAVKKELVLKDLRFTIVKKPISFVLGRKYYLTIHPLKEIVYNLARQISIKKNLKDANQCSIVVNCKYSQRINSLPKLLLQEAKKYYLDCQINALNKEIFVLEGRKKAIEDDLKAQLVAHEMYLARNLSQNKSLDLIAEEELLSSFQKTKLSIIEIEQKSKLAEKGDLFKNGEIIALLDERCKIEREIKMVSESLKREIAFLVDTPPFENKRAFSEIATLDLQEAKALLLNYNQKFDESREVISELKSILLKSKDANFPIAFSILDERGISRDLIEKGRSLEMLLKDEKNRSEKEGERIKADLSIQRYFIEKQVESILEREERASFYLEKKIKALQERIVERLKEKSAEIDIKIKEEKEKELANFRAEKELLLVKANIFQKNNLDIPQKWEFENAFKLKIEQLTASLTQISESLEGKIFNKKTKANERLVFDWEARAFWHSNSVLSFAFFFVFVVFGYLVYFLKAALRGFSVSEELLEDLGEKTLGTFFAEKFKTSETLAKAMLFIEKENAKVIGIIGNGYDNSHYIAINLVKMGKKVCLIKPERVNAFLLQKGEYDCFILNQHKLLGADLVREYIASIERDKYDYILLFTSSGAASIEGELFLSICDKIIVTLRDENVKKLSAVLGKSEKVVFMRVLE